MLGGADGPAGRFGVRRAQLTDWVFKNLTLCFALSTVLLILAIAFSLYLTSRANIHHTGARFLTGTTWDPAAPDALKPVGNLFGAVPFIYGTLLTSVVALLVAVPLGLGAAIFLSEIAPRWKHPVTLIIENGRCVDIQGKTEADQVRDFIAKYGDENSWLVGGEISIGLNKLCQKNNDSVREWKKHYGAMHFGVGHGADRGKINSILRLEGITDKITMTIDDTVVCEKGRFKI